MNLDKEDDGFVTTRTCTIVPNARLSFIGKKMHFDTMIKFWI